MSSPNKPDGVFQKASEETKSTAELAGVVPSHDQTNQALVITTEAPAVEEIRVSIVGAASGQTPVAVCATTATEPKTQNVEPVVVLTKLPEDAQAKDQVKDSTTSTIEEESMETDVESSEMEETRLEIGESKSEETHLEIGESKSEETHLEIGEPKSEMMEEDSTDQQPLKSLEEDSSDISEEQLIIIRTGENPSIKVYPYHKNGMKPAMMEHVAFDPDDTVASNTPTMEYDSSKDPLSPGETMEALQNKLKSFYKIQSYTPTDSNSASASPTSEAASSLPGDDLSMSKYDTSSVEDPAVPGPSNVLSELERAEILADSVDAMHVVNESDEPVRGGISMWDKRQELSHMESVGELTDSSTTTSHTTPQSESTSGSDGKDIPVDAPRKLSAGRISAEVQPDTSATTTPTSESVKLEEFLGLLPSIGEERSTPSPGGLQDKISPKGKMPVKRPLVRDVADPETSPTKRRRCTTTDSTTSPMAIRSSIRDTATSPIKELVEGSPKLQHAATCDATKRPCDEKESNGPTPSKQRKTEESSTSRESGTELSTPEESKTEKPEMSMETEKSGTCMETGIPITSTASKNGKPVASMESENGKQVTPMESETEKPGTSGKLEIEKMGTSVELETEKPEQSADSELSEEPSSMEQDSEEKKRG